MAQAEAGLNKLNKHIEMGMGDDEWDKMPVIPKTLSERKPSKESFKELLAEKRNSSKDSLQGFLAEKTAPGSAPAKLGGGGSHSMSQGSKPEIELSLSQDDLVQLTNSLNHMSASMPSQSATFGVPNTSGNSSQPTKPVISRLFGDDDDDDDEELAETGTNCPSYHNPYPQ